MICRFNTMKKTTKAKKKGVGILINLTNAQLKEVVSVFPSCYSGGFILIGNSIILTKK